MSMVCFMYVGGERGGDILAMELVLSCQPSVTVTSCFLQLLSKTLILHSTRAKRESIDKLCINTQVVYRFKAPDNYVNKHDVTVTLGWEDSTYRQLRSIIYAIFSKCISQLEKIIIMSSEFLTK